MNPQYPPHLTQQQRDDLLVVQQVESLTKRMEALWTQVFDKPESFGNKNQEEGLDNGDFKVVFERDTSNRALYH